MTYMTEYDEYKYEVYSFFLFGLQVLAQRLSVSIISRNRVNKEADKTAGIHLVINTPKNNTSSVNIFCNI